MKSTKTKMNNSLKRLKFQFEQAEEKISRLEDKTEKGVSLRNR